MSSVYAIIAWTKCIIDRGPVARPRIKWTRKMRPAPWIPAGLPNHRKFGHRPVRMDHTNLARTTESNLKPVWSAALR
ncbi:MAG: hypothetical protein QOH05_1845 [Acetobacteraceae bacterium]|jgi:hypothetical protein|nr:hypothetical protein [Acetobacteraceae bacterium]